MKAKNLNELAYMFDIPSEYQMPDMTFKDASNILEINGSVIKGMMNIRKIWEQYVDNPDHTYSSTSEPYECDDDFYSDWRYELNAYNILIAKLSPIFVGESNGTA